MSNKGKRKTGNSTFAPRRLSSGPPASIPVGTSAFPVMAVSVPTLRPIAGASDRLSPSTEEQFVADRSAVAEQLAPEFAPELFRREEMSGPRLSTRNTLSDGTRPTQERPAREGSGARILSLFGGASDVAPVAAETPEPREMREAAVPTPDELSFPPVVVHPIHTIDATPSAGPASARSSGSGVSVSSAPTHGVLHGLHGSELDDSFFADGENAAREEAERSHRSIPPELALEPEEEDENDPRSHKMTPAVRERRARLAKYVKGAVAVSAVVCMAALIRVAVVGGHHDEAAAVAKVGAAVVPVLQAAAPHPATVDRVPPPVAVAPVALAPKQPEPAPAVVAPPVPVAAQPVAEVAPAVSEAPTKTALEEKKDSRRALERGNAKLAIEAGERAVALDPTDGDAWLILGAAYQEKGKGAEANRCFSSCMKQGKKGAIGECRAMLR